MNDALAALADHFQMVFMEDGIQDTNEHLAIVRAFCESDSHLSVDDLLRRTSEKGINTSPDTVNSVMTRICEYGLARKVALDNGGMIYEHLHLDQHHDHMICTRCKKVMNFYDNRLEELKEAAATRRHFYPFRHRLEIYGLCSECLPRHADLRPLTQVAMGETVRVVTTGGGSQFVQRLADLGLVSETEVQVINNTGPVIVALGNTRIALGRGMASRILVK